MTDYLSSIMMCPKCKGELNLNELQDRVICINDSSHNFSYKNQILDFSELNEIENAQQRTKESFGVEWTKFYPKLGFDEKDFEVERMQFLSYTRSMPNFFNNKIILDAGCGNGRYLNIINRISHPDLLIACDISDSIYVARNNLSHVRNIVFIKCDIRRLCEVLKIKVDYIISIGVLHHTPNARNSFLSLAKLVADNGLFSAFIYGKGNPVLYRVNDYLRNKFFQRFSSNTVMVICWILSIPYQILSPIKVFGPWFLDLIQQFIFIDNVSNMYDAYTAGCTSFHTRSEVEEWYRTGGFEAVVEPRLKKRSLYCIGKKLPLG